MFSSDKLIILQLPVESRAGETAKFIFIFSPKNLHIPQRRITFALAKANNAYAQMAELVDALVSNTSGVKSIPVRSRVWVHRNACKSLTSVFLLLGSKRVAKKIKPSSSLGLYTRRPVC